MSKAFQTIVFIAGFAVMLAGLPGIALAGRVVIDDFIGDFHAVIVDSDGPLANPSFAAERPGVKGDWRQINATLDASGSEIAVIVNEGVLSFDLEAGTTGSAILTYNANGVGLGNGQGVSLLPGAVSSSFFALNLSRIDAGTTEDPIVFTVGVTTTDGSVLNSGSAEAQVSQAGLVQLPFTSFSNLSTLNFARVTEVTLQMQTANPDLDFTLDSFYTAVPEPSTIVLFGLGLAALYGTSRWRKRKAKSNV